MFGIDELRQKLYYKPCRSVILNSVSEIEGDMRVQINKLGGLWPVMITPFTKDGDIDYASMEKLIAWYEAHNADGLFAICQSSEIFYLSLREREQLVAFVKAYAHVPVIASGHVSNDIDDQINELRCVYDTGADALILITNRLAGQNESSEVFLRNLETIVNALPKDALLGLYECPYPYKRLITLEELKWCADSRRFFFMKDTCCDLAMIRDRIEVIRGSNLHLFNANTTTLLESLRLGAVGFSGVMANFHPEMYSWLIRNWHDKPWQAENVQNFLTMFSLIERQAYPVNAKYHLHEIEHLLADEYTRSMPKEMLTNTFKTEIHQMDLAAKAVKNTFCQGGVHAL